MFPSFLQGVKSSVSFLRDDIGTVVADLHERGFPMLSAHMGTMSLPHFASWRWATLDDCLATINRFAASWAVAFDAAIFKRGRDPTKLSRVCKALASSAWHAQLSAVSWFCRVMTSLLKRGG